MKQFLLDLYNIDLKSLLRKTTSVYQIDTRNGKFILKYVNQNNENLYRRLSLLDASSYFNLPLISKRNRYVEFYQDKYVAIFPFLEDDFISSKDLKLSFYIKAMAHLHKNSKYPINVTDSYFKESLSYLDEQIDKVEYEINTKMAIVEKEDYHSPYDWYFINNYIKLKNSLNLASSKIDKLEEKWNIEKDLSLSLTYQNFDFSHILINNSKIVSLEKMVLAPCIFDLYDFFINLRSETIPIKPYIKEYLEINPLKKFEIEWLFSLLYIPSINRKNNEIDDINSLMNTLKYINMADDLAQLFYVEEESS